jgi:hypothetical protein
MALTPASFSIAAEIELVGLMDERRVANVW